MGFVDRTYYDVYSILKVFMYYILTRIFSHCDPVIFHYGRLPAELGMLTDVRDLAVMNNQYLTGPVSTLLPSMLSLLY